jgi:biopolymer transport protein ExbD
MLKIPTSRKRKKPEEKLNLVPIMDSVFIFIFFLLMSASFLKIYEIMKFAVQTYFRKAETM